MIKYMTPSIEFVALSSRGILTVNVISKLDDSWTGDDWDSDEEI